MNSKWLGALMAAGFMAGAHASIITGTYDLTGQFGGSGSPFSNNHLVMDTTYDTDTNALSFVVTTFDLDGVSWLSRADRFIVEDLGGNARFRATFRQQTMPDGSRDTFEIFYRFIYNFNTDTPITGTVGNISSILSLASTTGNFGRGAGATFTPTDAPPPPPDPNSVPEPGMLALAALALVSAAAARRGI